MKYNIFTEIGHVEWQTCRLWLWRKPHFNRCLEKCLDGYWFVKNPQYRTWTLHLYGYFYLSAWR